MKFDKMWIFFLKLSGIGDLVVITDFTWSKFVSDFSFKLYWTRTPAKKAKRRVLVIILLIQPPFWADVFLICFFSAFMLKGAVG